MKNIQDILIQYVRHALLDELVMLSDLMIELIREMLSRNNMLGNVYSDPHDAEEYIRNFGDEALLTPDEKAEFIKIMERYLCESENKQ